MFIVKYIFLSTLSAEKYEAKDSCKNSFPPCNLQSQRPIGDSVVIGRYRYWYTVVFIIL